MKETISKKQLRLFAILISLGYPLVINFICPTLTDQSFKTWSVYIGVVLLVLSALYPRVVYYPYLLGREMLSNMISIISTMIILAAYIFIILPISIVAKSFGYDPLRTRFNRHGSYREITRKHIKFRGN